MTWYGRLTRHSRDPKVAVSPAVRYALGRIGLFVLVAVPVVVFLPSVDLLLKLMIALVVSAGLGFVLLRGVRAELAERMSSNARRKIEQRQRLRAALAGEDEPAGSRPDEPPRS